MYCIHQERAVLMSSQWHWCQLYLSSTGMLIETKVEICSYGLVYTSHLNLPTLKEAFVDIDERNLNFAKRNIVENNLKSRIRPLSTQPSGPLVPLDTLGINRLKCDHAQNRHSADSG